MQAISDAMRALAGPAQPGLADITLLPGPGARHVTNLDVRTAQYTIHASSSLAAAAALHCVLSEKLMDGREAVDDLL